MTPILSRCQAFVVKYMARSKNVKKSYFDYCLFFRAKIEDRDAQSTNLKADEEKFLREKQAAIRSQQTNLCLLFLFLIMPVLDIFLGTSLLKLENIISNSVQKCFVPIVTTVVNFGTIREVTAKYFNIFSLKVKNICAMSNKQK